MVSAANDDLPLSIFNNFYSMRNFAAISIQEPVYLKPGDNVVLPGVNQLTNNLTTNNCSTGLTHRPGRVIKVGITQRGYTLEKYPVHTFHSVFKVWAKFFP